LESGLELLSARVDGRVVCAVHGGYMAGTGRGHLPYGPGRAIYGLYATL